ncbi:ATP-binding protein [Mycobacterium sp.]|uniref:ATP-binding protein n=1 Tax=Mycobacterium sp. TaxID=1785 RepID=UPI003BAD501D
MANRAEKIRELNDAIDALEAQRSTLPAVAVESGLAALRGQLADLESGTAGADSGERCRATILFSDLCGYTAMSERLDPEDVEEVMGRVKAAAVRIVESRDGTVNQFVGDEVVALFGIPHAHEDDPCRAVDAAMELHAFVRELSAEMATKVGRPLRMHTGINTGLIVTNVRDQRDGTFGITGDVVNTGARLLAAADSDEILVSPLTRQLVAPYFEFGAVGSITMKGKSHAMVPYRVVKKTAIQTRIEAAEIKGFTPYAGREKELVSLRAAYSKAKASQGQFVAVRGEAGAGKSRLVAEFLQRVKPDVVVLSGRCQSHGQHAAYLPFTGVLRAAFGIDELDSTTAMQEKVVNGALALGSAFSQHLPALLRVLSIPSDRYPVPDELSGEGLQCSIHAALAATVSAVGRQQPLIVLLEDWQWVDEGSEAALKHIVDTVRADLTLLIVNYRSEYDPAWTGSVDLGIELGPLDATNGRSMIQAIYGADELPETLVVGILERAGGNPFFVEELCGFLWDQGIVRVAGGRVTLQERLDDGCLPETVHAVIRAKVDRLDPRSKSLLRPASVIGREFLVPVLDRVLKDSAKLEPLLQNLTSEDLIRLFRSSPELSYQFKHVITQEVTYETILRRQRAALHLLVAEAIEELYSARLEEHLEVLAFHYDRSDESERAIRYLELAGDKATKRFALVDARDYYQRALRRIDSAEDAEEERRKRVGLTLKWGEISVYSTPPQVIIPLLETAIGDAESIGLNVEVAQLSRLLGFLALRNQPGLAGSDRCWLLIVVDAAVVEK